MDNPLNLPKLDVRGLMKRYGLHPDKKLGQNFLIDHNYLQRVVDAGKISETDTVLEVGAGLGNLTRLLGMRARDVIAVEIDPDLLPILRDVTKTFPNIQIIQGDILKIDLVGLIHPDKYLVVANIPYYITSNLIRYLMSSRKRPSNVVLTIQKEVAERISAQSGKLSLLGLSVQVFGNPSILSGVPAGAFYPVPKVDSAIVQIEMYSSPLISEELLDTFFMLARAGFSQKRKTLRNSLSAGLRQDKTTIEELLADAGIDSRRRAETLSIEEWNNLTILYSGPQSP